MACPAGAHVALLQPGLALCVAPASRSWLDFVGPLLVFVSLVIAIIGVRSARASARQKATLDLIEKAESSAFYKDLNATFSATRRSRQWAHLHNPGDELAPARQKILDYLNHYELVSIGIRDRILDGGFYRRWMLGPFVRDWNAASGFIQIERWKYDPATARWTYHAALYETYQRVACDWSREAIRLDETSGGPPEPAGGPGQDPLPSAADAGAP